jgi:hypothetical protein
MSELPDNLAEAFEYLDELRDSGATNMFGAAPYLMGDFDFERPVAVAVVSAWMKTFDGDASPEDRAAKARGQS